MTNRYDRLLQEVENGNDLTKALRSALRLAIESEDDELTTWSQLELYGYTNGSPGFTGQEVPEYRTVAGRWLDNYGRQLMLENPDLAFFNTTRLRFGATELEGLLQSNNELLLPLADFAEIINRELAVEVSIFAFSPHTVPPVLEAIRGQLLRRLITSRGRLDQVSEIQPAGGEDVLEIRPNLYGVGINFRPLWRRWRTASGDRG